MFIWVQCISLDNKDKAKKRTNGHFFFLGFFPQSKYAVWSPVMELWIQIIISASLSKSWTTSSNPVTALLLLQAVGTISGWGAPGSSGTLPAVPLESVQSKSESAA